MKEKIENTKLLNESQTNKFQKQLEKQFGIKIIPGKIIQRGKDRVFLFTGNFEEEKIKELEKTIFIEKIGTYIATEVDGKYRLSIEGSQIFKNQITKNFTELNQIEMIEWMHGSEILKETNSRGFVIIKYQNDMLGTGKASEQKITNFIPKSRRLKRKEK